MPRRKKKKGNVPVVGSKQLHPVQISPRVRRLEAKRARAAAHREAAPEKAAAKEGVRAARRESRRSLTSARKGTQALAGTLEQALAGLGSTGLTGRERQQTSREFSGRIADAASALPALLAGLREEGAEDIGKARRELQGVRAAEKSSAASKFNSQLEELRNAGSSAIEAEQKERQGKRGEAAEGGEEDRGLRNAQIELTKFLDFWRKNKLVELDGKEVPIQQVNPLTSDSDWREVVKGMVEHGEGFDPTDALRAVKERRAEWRKQPTPLTPKGHTLYKPRK